MILSPEPFTYNKHRDITIYRFGKIQVRKDTIALTPPRHGDCHCIYGLFADAKCIYIGESSVPFQRQRQHENMRPSIYLAFVILRWCHPDDAMRLEGQITRAFWKRGQCKESVNRWPWQIAK